MCVHTCLSAYMCTLIHMYTRVRKHVHMYLYVHTHACADTCRHTYTHIYTYICIHTCLCAHTCMCIHMQTHVHKHAYIHFYTCAHTCIHTSQSFLQSFLSIFPCLLSDKSRQMTSSKEHPTERVGRDMSGDTVAVLGHGTRDTTVQHSCPGNGRPSSFCSQKRTRLAGPGSGCRPGSSRCTWLWGKRKSQVCLRIKLWEAAYVPLAVWLCQVCST